MKTHNRAARCTIVPYTPRPLQRALHRALEAHRFVVGVGHRRFGKSVLAVNHLQKGALTGKRQRPRFAYIGPTYRQAKAVAWDYMQFYAKAIPGIVVNQQELRIDYPNGGQVRIYGSDNEDSLRGIYLDGVVLDEYGLQSPRVFSEVVRPALADRGGWALFIGTPNGKNQFYEIVQQAKRAEPGWFSAEYKASDTGILSAEELTAARSVMTADEYAQEFECSFQASVRGAIYGTELDALRAAGRICTVPHEPTLPVDTDWDLGVGDATAIWFSQSLRSGEIRIIDYYEASGEGLPHYAQVLKERAYTYGDHWAPMTFACGSWVRVAVGGRRRRALGSTSRWCPTSPLKRGFMRLGCCYRDAGSMRRVRRRASRRCSTTGGTTTPV